MKEELEKERLAKIEKFHEAFGEPDEETKRKYDKRRVEILKKEAEEKRVTLGEFIKAFSHNNLIRLHYKKKRGHECVLDSYDDVSMDWEVPKGKGKNRHFVDNKVMGLIGIGGIKRHEDAINIVIEELEDQPWIDEVIDDNKYGNTEAVAD